ncbi:AraC family transcriptional regulator [Marinobacter daepoensis]|uniref:AraC family transcriptional regulator n=1 Tax=Marinobacter daepoensis TaxID=262077 RepID=A0ABS3BDF9_9GAMM|nr:AraC family transcriptional regulator [Marinobacter daepoensis]MBN7769854.1 AraC family transcriptional regulator [Marinobacter daepoensis]MBY6032712.1 AraC family transcriptional regulator [Marinobacter daepoensis]MBY6080242.1 AraC family transcriptional regulator [Marinobacter daepoensis]
MRASVSTSQDLGMPAIYLHTLAELLHTLGVDERDLILRVGLDPTRLNSTDRRVSQAQASEFVTRAIIESGEPGLGILLARELKLPLHGALGTAVMSSRTLAEALELMTRYLTLRAPHLHVQKRSAGNSVWYSVSCGIELGPLQGFVLDAVLFGCVSMGAQLTGTTVPGIRVLRQSPEPNHFHRFRRLINVPVEFGATEDALVIPASQLTLPVRFSNDQLAMTSREQCETALRQLKEDTGFASRVRRVIETSHPFPPKLARVASTLFVSERTLKRRLQEEGANFQALVDKVRLERARELLASTAMNLSQIADTLGYADAANFTRAFKRWTGLSPSHFRTRELSTAETA